MHFRYKLTSLFFVIGFLLFSVLSGCAHKSSDNVVTITAPIASRFNHLQIPHLQVRLNKFSSMHDKDDHERIFINSGGMSGVPDGAEIVTRGGTPIWFYTPPTGQVVRGFRVQTYHGKPVLTWWQGIYDYVGGGNWHGIGTDYIVDEHYRVIAKIAPRNVPPDGHEFRLLSNGTALISSHKKRRADLSSIGGPETGQIWDGTAAIVDVEHNTVLSQWDAYEHVPISETYASLQDKNEYHAGVFNPYQLNSISASPDGDLLVSLRNTSTVYLVDPRTGKTIWHLGGKHSSFTLESGVEFMAQHDAQFLKNDRILMFNDNSNGFHTYGPSSVELLQLQIGTRTATLIRNQIRPDQAQATGTGSAELLPSDGFFADWGDTGKLCEFNSHGQLLYDAMLPKGGFSYRAYLAPWKGDAGIIFGLQGKAEQ